MKFVVKEAVVQPIASDVLVVREVVAWLTVYVTRRPGDGRLGDDGLGGTRRCQARTSPVLRGEENV